MGDEMSETNWSGWDYTAPCPKCGDDLDADGTLLAELDPVLIGAVKCQCGAELEVEAEVAASFRIRAARGALDESEPSR